VGGEILISWNIRIPDSIRSVFGFIVSKIDTLLGPLSHWLIYGLILSLLPIFFGCWKIAASSSGSSFGDAFKNVISHGELLLISSVLIGGSIGELLKNGTNWIRLRNSVVGCGIVAAMFSIYSYSEIASNVYPLNSIFMTSLSTFGGALGLCFSTIIIGTLGGGND
jgi:hypothetical protein